MKAARIVEVPPVPPSPAPIAAPPPPKVNKPYEFQTIPVPEPEGSDILVKVGAASFCHTDALALNGEWPVRTPCTGSHEGAGTVAKLGPDVPMGKFKVGDRVGLHCFYHVCGMTPLLRKGGFPDEIVLSSSGEGEFPGRCAGFELRVGNCETCKKGGRAIMFCPNKRGALGLQEVDGSFAEYVIADSMFTVPIPDNVSFADAVTPHTIPLPPSP